MRDLNYFPLNVESNIYGMTSLEFEDKTSKVLVATLDCQIFCINYSKFKPQTKEVEFTYIPNGAKIISIGALKRGPDDFVIGITHSLAPATQKGSSRSSSGRGEVGEYGRSTTYYFNIYASGSGLSKFDLDYVAQGCQTIRLRYVPYHLYQTELISIIDPETMEIEKKPYWLLSGGDNSIHAFCEDKLCQSFNEKPIGECFGELSNLPGLALWIDVMNLEGSIQNGYERATVLGFEDGSVIFYHSVLSRSTATFELVKKCSFDDYTTIVPSVRLFQVKSTLHQSRLRQALKSENILTESKDRKLEQLNLLVVSSTSPSLVFEDVLEFGLDKRYELPESQRLDCAVTSAIGDTNLDGRNEILIGTHGQELLIYHYDTKAGVYSLSEVSELNHPIFSMSILDLTGDSTKNVTLLLASGILVLQAAVNDVIKIFKRRLDILLSLLP